MRSQQPRPQRLDDGAAAGVHLQLGVNISQVRVDGVRLMKSAAGISFCM